MSDTNTPEDAAAVNAGPSRDAHGRFIYDTTYDPADGDKYDDDSHLAGLEDGDV
jgi:hypothetical protein